MAYEYLYGKNHYDDNCGMSNPTYTRDGNLTTYGSFNYGDTPGSVTFCVPSFRSPAWDSPAQQASYTALDLICKITTSGFTSAVWSLLYNLTGNMNPGTTWRATSSDNVTEQTYVLSLTNPTTRNLDLVIAELFVDGAPTNGTCTSLSST